MLLVVSITLLKLMAGCIFEKCSCPTPEELDLNFNKAIINSVNNSDGYIDRNPEADTIPSKAIGFKIRLTDSTYYENPEYNMYAHAFQRHLSFFNEAQAMDCRCQYFEYKPIKNLSLIHVKTLLNFSPDYMAGSDMTDLFVGYINNYSAQGLYSTLADVIDYYGVKDKLYNPTIDFSLFLKQASTTDSLQFEITFEFDDNSYLTDTTSVVFPIY